MSRLLCLPLVPIMSRGGDTNFLLEGAKELGGLEFFTREANLIRYTILRKISLLKSVYFFLEGPWPRSSPQ